MAVTMMDTVKDANAEVAKCSCNVVHQDVVDHIGSKMPGERITDDMAEAFKVFGDRTRVKLLYALSIGEMCVCDLSALLEMTQSAVSHQLRVLKQARLVKWRREGKIVYYSLDDSHVSNILAQGYAHVTEEA